MVKIMENPSVIKRIIWGESPLFSETLFWSPRGPFFFQFSAGSPALIGSPSLRLDALMTSRSLMPLGETLERFEE